MPSSRRKDVKRLMFEVSSSPMGLITFSNINKLHGVASFGFYLGNMKLPRGTGTLMTFLALNFGFAEQCIRKLMAESLATNPQGMSALKRLGFAQEGYLKQQVYKDGRFIDIVILSLLASNWRDTHRQRVESVLRAREGTSPC